MDFAVGSLALSAGGEDEGRAEEQLEAEFDGEELVSAFKPVVFCSTGSPRWARLLPGCCSPQARNRSSSAPPAASRPTTRT
jgi:hypothetical protein